MGTVRYQVTPTGKRVTHIDSTGAITSTRDIPAFKQLEVVEAHRETKTTLPNHFKRAQRYYVGALGSGLGFLYPTMVKASEIAAETSIGGQNLIQLLQDASFWVGMGITIWGIVEAQLDFPGWKGRIAKGIIGYIGILLVPMIFIELQDSLQLNVWAKMDGGK